MKQTTKRLLAELKTLRDSGDANIYQRIKVAESVIDDADWLNEFHDGDPTAAVASLEHEFFSMLGGSPTLGQLITAYKTFPDESAWKEYRYNVRIMVDLAAEKTASNSNGENVERKQYKKMYAEAEKTIEDLEYNGRRDRQAVESFTTELEAVKEELARANQEIARLNGQIEVLRRTPVTA